MALSWKSSIKLERESSELRDVAHWLVDGLGVWPAQFLAWLVEDGPEPSFVAGLDVLKALDEHFSKPDEELEKLREQVAEHGVGASSLELIEQASAKQIEVSALTSQDLRKWRDSIAGAAIENQAVETWIHSADLDDAQVTIQILSSAEHGRWSSFTIASFVAIDEEDADNNRDGESQRKTVWTRFEPQASKPCMSWVIITSEGFVGSLEAKADGSREVDLQQRDVQDEKAKAIQWGSGSIRTNADGIEIHGDQIRLEGTKTRIQSVKASFSTRGRGKHRIESAVKVSAILRPFFFNLARPFVPIARLVLGRKVNGLLIGNLDLMMKNQVWQDVVNLARASRPSDS